MSFLSALKRQTQKTIQLLKYLLNIIIIILQDTTEDIETNNRKF